MAFLTFRGGIHPYDGKDLSKNCPVEKYLPKGDLAILVSQHIGAPAKPIVKRWSCACRTENRRSRRICFRTDTFVCIRNRKGDRETSDRSRRHGWCDHHWEWRSVRICGICTCKAFGSFKEDILKRIQEGGVVGQGGAGFPTHVKLSPKEPDKIDHILVNGAECEPYITSDYRRMMEEPESIVGGLEVILKAFPKAVGCICIEDNKPDCIARMKEAIKGKERMEVKRA